MQTERFLLKILTQMQLNKNRNCCSCCCYYYRSGESKQCWLPASRWHLTLITELKSFFLNKLAIADNHSKHSKTAKILTTLRPDKNDVGFPRLNNEVKWKEACTGILNSNNYAQVPSKLNRITSLQWSHVVNNMHTGNRSISYHMTSIMNLYSASSQSLSCTVYANKLCGRPPQYAPVPASWPLTFWSWKWCLSHVWRGLPLCQF